MREHCARGYQMLRKIPFLQEAAEIVYSHQEHYDGSGYPRKLKGEEIPLGARIFAVADTLDAITSDRPYRKGATFLRGAAGDQALRRHAVRSQGGGGVSQPARPVVGGPAGGDHASNKEIFTPAAWRPRTGRSCATLRLKIADRKSAPGLARNKGKMGPEKGVPMSILTPEIVQEGLRSLPQWKLEGKEIVRHYQFPDFVSRHGLRKPGGGKGGERPDTIRTLISAITR